jgi:menaquinol-cytochrome c reductase iron-sulfur subunit
MALLDRRAFTEALLRGGQGLLALMAALAAAPAGFFFAFGARKAAAQADPWVDLGPEAEFSDGPWRARRFRRSVEDRWKRTVMDETVYVRRSGANVEAVSAICTHTGCLVQRLAPQGFACPCHRSDFDEEGRPLGGPAPRPLDRLEAKIDGDRVKVRYVRFRPGLPTSEPIGG